MKTNTQVCYDHSPSKKKAWYHRPLYLTLLGTSFLLALSLFVPFLGPFRHEFIRYSEMMALPIFLGLVLGGIVDYYVPQEYISKHLGRKGKRTIFYSIGAGFLMSACSHGILALSIELHKKGASGPAVVSFLLASPWSSLPITILLIGFFGWKAFVIIGMALFVALVTGLFFQVLERKKWIEENPHAVAVPKDFSIRKDIARRFREYRMTVSGLVRDVRGIVRGMGSLMHMVFWWVLLGAVLASFAAAFVPEDIFQNYFGPTGLGLLMTLALATVLEVCSEGTAPLAFEIYRQTAAFGNVFVFLMAGVVTDYTEIGLIWYNLGRKTALWMIAVTVPQVLFWGWIFNLIF